MCVPGGISTGGLTEKDPLNVGVTHPWTRFLHC